MASKDTCAACSAARRRTPSEYSPRGRFSSASSEYLHSRGLDHPELVAHFKLGLADRTLGLRLPEKTRNAGGDIRAQLPKIGLYRDRGHEHFNGSLVVPVFDEAGNVAEVYGHKLLDNLRASAPKHLYLPAREGRGRGVFNVQALMASKEVILGEALIDALTFWCAGYRNVTSSYGIEGFTEEHVTAFKRHGTERVLVAYERGAAKVAERLIAEGIECFRVQFPKGMEANEYALKARPAAKSLGLLIRKAVCLGKGAAPAQAVAEPVAAKEVTTAPAAKAARAQAPAVPSLAAPAAAPVIETLPASPMPATARGLPMMVTSSIGQSRRAHERAIRPSSACPKSHSRCSTRARSRARRFNAATRR